MCTCWLIRIAPRQGLDEEQWACFELAGARGRNCGPCAAPLCSMIAGIDITAGLQWLHATRDIAGIGITIGTTIGTARRVCCFVAILVVWTDGLNVALLSTQRATTFSFLTICLHIYTILSVSLFLPLPLLDLPFP